MRDLVFIIKNHLKGIVVALDTAEKRIEEERAKKLKEKYKKVDINNVR